MSEVFELAATVVDVLGIANTVLTTLYRYHGAVQNAPKESKRMQEQVKGLRDVLESVLALDTIGSNNSRLDLGSLAKPDGPVSVCKTELEALQEKLELKEGWRGKLDALKWPLNVTEMKKTFDRLEQHKSTISVALAVAQGKLAMDTNEGVIGLQETLREMKLDEHLRKILTWLAAPDASTNYHDARKKHQPGTCAWFTQGDVFKRWISELRSLLWVNGLPGSGKTILSSEVIRYLLLLISKQLNSALGYFYCDFKNDQKGLVGGLLRSLISQLLAASPRIPQSLEHLYSQCQDGHRQPSTDELVHALKSVFGLFERVYIVVDALDESTERDELMTVLGDISGWKLNHVHILATSRKERDIEQSLGAWPTVNINETLVNEDIQLHVDEVLQQDKKLSKLPRKIKDEIRDTLMQGANGMFRWVACQIDVLRDQGSPKALRDALKSLPSTLDETYERILTNISQQRRPIALRILEWVAFSADSVSLAEINEAIAVELDEEPRFDPNNRLFDPQDLLSYCPSLVTISSSVVDYRRRVDIENSCYEASADRVISLAHFTVKEYLVSDRIRHGKVSFYSLDQQLVNASICRVCLVYLMQFEEVQSDIPPDLPLTRYAAEFWTHHVKSCNIVKDEYLEKLIMQFLQPSSAHYQSWPKFYNLDRPWKRGRDAVVLSPVYYMSRTGIEHICRLLLKGHAGITEDKGDFCCDADVNMKGGVYGNALQAAAHGGHHNVVKLLLDRGADVNAQGGGYGNTLQAAAYEGSVEVVKVLLDRGADMNAQGGIYGNALQAGAKKGSVEVMKVLLDRGADVNVQGAILGNALQVGAYKGSVEVVQLLLDRSADVNVQGGPYGNALQAAAYWGRLETVQLLLDNGADIHARGGKYGSPLEAAISRGHTNIVKLLESRGAMRCEDEDSTDDSSHPIPPPDTEFPNPMDVLERSADQRQRSSPLPRLPSSFARKRNTSSENLSLTVDLFVASIFSCTQPG